MEIGKLRTPRIRECGGLLSAWVCLLLAFLVHLPLYWGVSRWAPRALGATGVVPIALVAMTSTVAVTVAAALFTLPWGVLLAVTVGPGWQWLAARWEMVLLGTGIGVILGVLISFNRTLYRRLQRESRHVLALEGMLDVCPACSRVAAEDGGRIPLEAFLEQHSGAAVDHRLCPDCAHRLELRKTADRPLPAADAPAVFPGSST